MGDGNLSVVIVNRNRAELLRQCLLSLQGQTLPADEILVVDNASTDSSLTIAKEFAPQGVRWIGLDRNFGFAGANNRGFEQSRGRFVALLNNDAQADPRWLEFLVRPLWDSARVGMCASKILLSDSGRIDKAGHLIFPDGQNRGRGSGEVDRGQFDQIRDCLFPDGCAAIFRRRVLQQTGGFDEDFFAYGDDADLGLRARLLGWECRFVPQAVVYHQHSATSGPYSMQKIYWVERNRLWLAVKTFPFLLLLLNPFLTAYRWGWNGLAALLGQGAAGHFRRRVSWWGLLKTWARAYRDGLKGVPRMWRKRARLKSSKQISAIDFVRLLLRHRISARTLSFRDQYSERRRP